MYKRTDEKIWTGRIDTEDGVLGSRWHQIIDIIDLETETLPPLSKQDKGYVILGFCCDEGIRRNKGRTGARNGPEAIRQTCTTLAWHHETEYIYLFDGGDIVCVDQNLDQAQAALQSCISKILQAGYLPIILGGGHEVAFGSFKGIRDQYPDKKIGIINFDAHFDLRQYPQGGHSGSSFLQIADYCSANNQPFSYLVLGIQKKSNTQMLYRKAGELAVSFYEAKKLFEMPALTIQKNINDFINQQDFIYLTLCMDVFDQAYAPAVSAPAACGISPQLAMPLFSCIAASGKLVLFDVAELNPQFDRDGQTARLAAHLIFSIVEGCI
jgi:formiminoglutamase